MERPLHVDVEALIIKTVVLVDSRVTGSDRQMEHGSSTVHGRGEGLPIEDVRPHVPRIVSRHVWGQQMQIELALQVGQHAMGHLTRGAGNQDKRHRQALLLSRSRIAIV